MLIPKKIKKNYTHFPQKVTFKKKFTNQHLQITYSTQIIQNPKKKILKLQIFKSNAAKKLTRRFALAVRM